MGEDTVEKKGPGRPARVEVNEDTATQPGTGNPLHKAKESLLKKKNLSEEQRERLRMALSDMSGGSQLKVINPDDDYHYFFAAKDPNHPNSVDATKRLGYEIVNRENNSGEALPYGDVADTSGGALQLHDLVLMRIPKEYHQARMEMIAEQGQRRIESSEEAMEEMARRVESGDMSAANNGRRIFIF